MVDTSTQSKTSSTCGRLGWEGDLIVTDVGDTTLVRGAEDDTVTVLRGAVDSRGSSLRRLTSSFPIQGVSKHD